MICKWIFSNRVIRQYMAGMSCCLSMSMLASAVNWPAPAIPKLQGERPNVTLTTNEITWMVSSLYIGNLIGPIPGGRVMDRLGRKTTLLYATIITLLSWVILYFATVPYQFYIGRILCGISNGIIYTITPVYIAEIAEPSIRGSIGNMMSILANLSAVYIYCIGVYTSYEGLIIATSAIPVLFLLTFMWIPESPYYYILKEDHEKAKKSLTWFRCDKTSDDVIGELKIIETYMKQQMQSKSCFIDLLTNKGTRKGLCITIFVTTLQRFTGIGALMSYSSVTIPKNSLPFLTLENCVMLLSVVWFIAPIISLLFIDRFGRRVLLIISSLGCGLTTLIPSVWFYLDEKTTGYEDIVNRYVWVPYVSFLCHGVFYATGIGTLGTSMRGELFPSNAKATASAVTSICLAVASFTISKFFLLIADSYGMFLSFSIFSAACFSSIVITYVYVIETKGKTLEEIQDELNGVNKIHKMTINL